MGLIARGQVAQWRRAPSGVVILTAVLVAAGAIQANAQTPQQQPAAVQHSFSVPRQPLAGALTTFGRQSGMQVSVDAGAIRGGASPGVTGSLASEQALARLLAGTGFTFRLTAPNTAMLERIPAGSPTGALTLPPVQVEGLEGVETASGPTEGYVAHQSATATKTDTPLLETPQAISVVGRDQIAAQAAHTLVGALGYTPGVQTGQDPVENRFDSLLIRGFQPTLFLDGMQLPSGASQFGRSMVDPFSLERIEVLRGPSSSLYGKIAPGGLVNMVSLRPPAEATHMLDVQGNNFGQLQGGFDLGGPLNQDGTLLYRLTGLVHGGGTQIDHVDDRRIMIAPAFTWRPDDDTSLTFLSQFQRDDSGVEIQFLPAQGTLLSNPNGTVPVGRFLGEPGFDGYRRTQYWLGYQFEHRFNDNVTVRQNFRYANLNTDLFAVIGVGLQSDIKTLNRLGYYVAERAQNITLDNQAELHFRTGPLAHTALVGVDYRWVTSRFEMGTGPAPTLNIFDPVYGAPITPPTATTRTGQVQNQIGVYAQDQIALGRWRLTLSGRHDWVSTATQNFVAGTHQDQDDGAFSGRAGVNYVFDFGLSPYVAYAHSFQPTLGTTFNGAPFKPTTGDEYEAGLKYQPPGTNVALNAALYTLTEQNALASDGAHVGFQVQTGEIRARGIELDATASLTNGLNLVAAYTYTDAENTNGAATTIGKRPIGVPRHSVSLWGDYALPSGPLQGLGFGGGVRYFGDTFGDAANTLHIPGYALLDATLHYDLGQVRPQLSGAKLVLNATNLLDKRYVATCTSLSACYYGTGRMVTVDLHTQW